MVLCLISLTLAATKKSCLKVEGKGALTGLLMLTFLHLVFHDIDIEVILVIFILKTTCLDFLLERCKLFKVIEHLDNWKSQVFIFSRRHI
jgi:hypothetical protein